MPGGDEVRPKLTTEEAMLAYTVGKLEPRSGPILLCEYDPRWPELFEEHAVKVRAALGRRVQLLEHVGSTSVPGLCAKPQVDLVLAVDDSSNEPSYLPDLEHAGYILRIREPDWYEHRVFNHPDLKLNLHVFSTGCPEVTQMLLFRDWLRKSPSDRELYAHAKRDLAQRDWKYIQHYADAKTTVVQEILARARSHRPAP